MESVQRLYGDFFIHQYRRLSLSFDAPYACVIVEPRKHPHLEWVVKNVMYFLPHWSLYIFHSRENESFVRNLIGSENENQVHFHEICAQNLTIEEYNVLLTSPSFWSSIHAEDILIFQTDSYIRRWGIESFLHHEFCMIGAPWPGVGDQPHVGNGGFSFRKKSAMLQLISSPRRPRLAEDVFFYETANKYKMKMPTKNVSRMFSTEALYQPDSYAVHKSWTSGHRSLSIDIHSSWLVYLPADRSFLCKDSTEWTVRYPPYGYIMRLPVGKDATLHVNRGVQIFCGHTNQTERVLEQRLVMVPRDKTLLGLPPTAVIHVYRGDESIGVVQPHERAPFAMDKEHPLCFCWEEKNTTLAILDYNRWKSSS
jgi:hypothetical protein